MKALLGILCCTLFASAGFANPVMFSTTGFGPIFFQADVFSLSGESGTLDLSSGSVTTANINTATLFAGNSGPFNGSESLSINYTLTLAGISHIVSQNATWTVTTTLNSFVTIQASSPFTFDLGTDGVFNVILDAYRLDATIVGQTVTTQTAAEFSP